MPWTLINVCNNRNHFALTLELFHLFCSEKRTDDAEHSLGSNSDDDTSSTDSSSGTSSQAETSSDTESTVSSSDGDSDSESTSASSDLSEDVVMAKKQNAKRQ
jgi:hypothetical protein